MADQSLKKVMVFFGMSAKEMMTEWKPLSDSEKAQVRTGIEGGSLTY